MSPVVPCTWAQHRKDVARYDELVEELVDIDFVLFAILMSAAGDYNYYVITIIISKYELR